MTPNGRKPVNLHLQPDWQRALGQYVEIRRHSAVVRTGTVEAVMPDCSILWISAAGPQPRVLYERAEGYQVYARYPWDPVPVADLKQPVLDEGNTAGGLPSPVAPTNL